jgi:hypothetical protein
MICSSSNSWRIDHNAIRYFFAAGIRGNQIDRILKRTVSTEEYAAPGKIGLPASKEYCIVPPGGITKQQNQLRCGAHYYAPIFLKLPLVFHPYLPYRIGAVSRQADNGFVYGEQVSKDPVLFGIVDGRRSFL